MNELLEHTAHRPWPLLTRRWTMFQRWHELLFAHWPLPIEALRPHIPADLQIDTFDGQAWIGVVPFRMSHIHPRGFPALPWISFFPELNVRTYVTDGAKPGVWFFSLEAGNPLAVAIARSQFHLPYFNARMVCDGQPTGVRYRSERTHRGAPPAAFEADYWPTGDVYQSAHGTLDSWLTERYCLYTTDWQGRLYRGEIHHQPWPLQPAEAEIAVNTMASAAGVSLPDVEPILHYAHRLDVLVWPLELATR